MSISQKIKRKVNRAIRDFSLFSRQDKIAVALSGGKDSLGVASVLKELNYRAEGVFIHLGIGDFSRESLQRVEVFCGEREILLHVIDIEQTEGSSIPEMAARYPAQSCAVCGSFKRKMLNRFALEKGFDVLVTGHHMEDEIVSLFANNLRWDWGYLKKSVPAMKKKKGFIKRAKPLCYCRNDEMLEYAAEENIETVELICPYSEKGTRRKYEKVMEEVERQFPGMGEQYYKNFLKNFNFLENFQEEGLSLKTCELCGEITSHSPCRICLIKRGEWKR